MRPQMRHLPRGYDQRRPYAVFLQDGSDTLVIAFLIELGPCESRRNNVPVLGSAGLRTIPLSQRRAEIDIIPS